MIVIDVGLATVEIEALDGYRYSFFVENGSREHEEIANTVYSISPYSISIDTTNEYESIVTFSEKVDDLHIKDNLSLLPSFH